MNELNIIKILLLFIPGFVLGVGIFYLILILKDSV